MCKAKESIQLPEAPDKAMRTTFNRRGECRIRQPRIAQERNAARKDSPKAFKAVECVCP